MYSMAALLGAQPRVYTEPGGTEFPNPVAPVSAQRTCPTWGFCSRKFNCIYLWQRNVPKTYMYLFVSQIQGLTWFMEEGNLERRMQVSSSEEEKDLAALMKL
jgi:hypothetical protein